jgi:2-dehydropantoate 2-reductase
MRIAVVGAGSLGTVVGAMLTRAGLDVSMVAASQESVTALNQKGSKVVGKLDITQPVKALTPDKMEGIYDLVIYLVKVFHDEQALPQVLPHLGPDSVLITLQNGIPEEKVASFVGKERTLGGAVMWAAERLEPGVSRMTSDPDQMDYDIGELDGRVTERIKGVKAVLDHAGRAIITENLQGLRWTKFLVNAAYSGMSTALGVAAGEIMNNDRATDAAIHIMIETILTARALGIEMEPIRGVETGILLDIARQDMESLRSLISNTGSDFRDTKASMLHDLEKGRPCEVESLNGYLAEIATKAGVSAPVNDQVTKIIREIQDGKMSYGFSNLELLELPPLSIYFDDLTP